jgi:hypothetical protein
MSEEFFSSIGKRSFPRSPVFETTATWIGASMFEQSRWL